MQITSIYSRIVKIQEFEAIASLGTHLKINKKTFTRNMCDIEVYHKAARDGFVGVLKVNDV